MSRWTKFLVIAVILLGSVLTTVVLWPVRVDVSSDTSVIRSFGGDYDLVYKSTGEVAIANVEGWLVSPRHILGSFRDERYYAIDRVCGTKRTFSSIQKFDEWLVANQASYSYSEEEGPASVFLDKRTPRFLQVQRSTSGHCVRNLFG